jgi:MoaA/NifB/PqqE/SkfB family radical SAM enzyme
LAGIEENVRPTSAVIAVTYRCNSRCKTCDIWKKDATPELGPEGFKRLPEGLRNINISGGEPFLRNDLVDIIGVLRKKYPRASIVISTNGLFPERIEKDVKRMGQIGVRVSIDAFGASDDEVRGIEGAFALATETLDRLKAQGLKDLGISATISRQTVGDSRKLKEMAEIRGIEFVTSLVHSSSVYFGEHKDKLPEKGSLEKETIQKELIWLRERELSSGKPKDWFRAYLTDGIIDQIEGKRRRIRCYAGRCLFFMEPGGDIYPCNIWPERMGNILRQSYDEMAAQSGRIFAEVDKCPFQCWMSCTVAPVMRQKPFGPALWVAARKLGIGKKHEDSSSK